MIQGPDFNTRAFEENCYSTTTWAGPRCYNGSVNQKVVARYRKGITMRHNRRMRRAIQPSVPDESTTSRMGERGTELVEPTAS